MRAGRGEKSYNNTHNDAIQKGIELKVHDSLVVNIDKWHDCWLLGLFEDQADPMRLSRDLRLGRMWRSGGVSVYEMVRVDLII